MNRLPLLLLIDSLSFGGAERQFVELTKGISRVNWIEPHVCFLEDRGSGYAEELERLGVRMWNLRRSRKFDVGLLLKIRRYVFRERIELIHSFSILAGTVATICAKTCRIPVVASTIRDAKDRDLMTSLSIKFQARLADRFIANSYAGFNNRFRGMRDSFRVIYNGFDMARAVSQPQQSLLFRQEFGLERFKYLICMVASLSPYKDYDTFLEAAPLVLQVEPSTGFLVIGDGGERRRLEEKAKALCVASSVVFTGNLQHVMHALENCSVSVLMTNVQLHSEGISNALLEAMAVGVPVICSRGGGTDELIESGTNGILSAAVQQGCTRQSRPIYRARFRVGFEPSRCS